MSACDRDYAEGVSSRFDYVVEGRGDAGEPWTELGRYDTKREADGRLARMGVCRIYRDLRIMRRASA